LNKQVGAIFTQNLASSEFKTRPGEWYQVVMAVQGNRVMATINGKIALDYLDPQPLTEGTFSYETLDNSSACFDDAIVRDLTGKPPLFPSAESKNESTGILYANNFDSPVGNEWLFGPGWAVAEGQLCGQGSEYAVLLKPMFDDYTLTLRLRFSGNIHLNLRSQMDPWRRYQVMFSTSEQRVTVRKQTADNIVSDILEEAPFAFQPDTWYTVLLSINRGILQVRVDQQKLFLFLDRKPLSGGSFTIQLMDSSACVDELLIQPPLLDLP
jgi:hypothetical protein